MPGIRVLLEENGLPTSDLSVDVIQDFLVAVDDVKLLGVVGLEHYAEYALLRSLAVHAHFRSHGLGTTLLQAIERHAIAQGVKELYALTLTAESYLVRHGYRVIDRAVVPSAVLQTAEFRTLCPDSAICLRKTLR